MIIQIISEYCIRLIIKKREKVFLTTILKLLKVVFHN